MVTIDGEEMWQTVDTEGKPYTFEKIKSDLEWWYRQRYGESRMIEIVTVE
jgi:hypothetical protein